MTSFCALGSVGVVDFLSGKTHTSVHLSGFAHMSVTESVRLLEPLKRRLPRLVKSKTPRNRRQKPERLDKNKRHNACVGYNREEGVSLHQMPASRKGGWEIPDFLTDIVVLYPRICSMTFVVLKMKGASSL